MCRPAIKYVGSKRKLLTEIDNYIPKDTTVIIEPFSGSAALSFSKELPFYLVDKSPELVNFLQVLNNGNAYMRMLELLDIFSKSHSKEFYLDVRATDRKPRFDHLPRVYRAARYYYIIYSGFNGLYRVNKANYCNTPWGDRGFSPDVETLTNCHLHLKEYCKGIHFQEFNDMDLYQSIIDSEEKPFVLIDPPYYGDKVFKAYTPEGDGGDFYFDLYNFICDLDEANVPFLMTNSDDKFIDDMFSEWGIDKVATRYTVAADGNKRGTKFESFVHNADVDKLVKEGAWTR